VKFGGGVFVFNFFVDLVVCNEVDFVVYLGDYVYEFGWLGYVLFWFCMMFEDYWCCYG